MHCGRGPNPGLVCINQADIPEKNHQVATMRKVYSTACNVLIWLGPTDVKTEEAFSIMTKLYRVATLNISSLSKDFSNLLNTRLAPNDQTADLYRQCGSLDPLLDFFTRPWFTRLWIVQEVLLARKISCICGHRRVQFDEIGLSAAAIVTYRGDDIYQHPVKHYIKCIYTLFMALKMRSAWNFERALESSVSFRTSDPLDKIYAAMGFMDDEAIKRLPQSISCPNYDQKPSILYTKVTRFVLEHSASLRLLDFLCTQKAMNITNQDISCPSWVPRYDMSSEDLPAVLTRYAPPYPMSYTADNGVGKITEHAGLEDEACDAGVFALKGIFVDRVEGQLRPLSLDSINGSIAEVMNGFRSLITDTSSARYGDELMLAMAICLLGGGSEDLKPTEFQPSQLSRLLEGNSNFEITEEEVYSIIGSVFGKAHGRILFRTEEGFLGSGPIDMEPGDAIYILFGSGLAFVLRQQDATAAKFDSPLFNLVGGAYVHGIMKVSHILHASVATLTSIL